MRNGAQERAAQENHETDEKHKKIQSANRDHG